MAKFQTFPHLYPGYWDGDKVLIAGILVRGESDIDEDREAEILEKWTEFLVVDFKTGVPSFVVMKDVVWETAFWDNNELDDHEH